MNSCRPTSRGRLGLAILLVAAAVPYGPATLGAGIAKARPPSFVPAELDITAGFEGLPTAKPGSSGEEVAAAIQSRLDWLFLHNTPGRVVIPPGRWTLSRPVFMNGDHKELVGAGVGRTIIEAAEGYRAMPMINTSTRTYFPDRPLQPCNRPELTAPAARVLDESVPGRRFGLRTYAEFPSTNFPRESHLALGGGGTKPWAPETAYAVGDVVRIAAPPMPDHAEAACVKAHQASPETQPLRGRDWQGHWVIKVPFGVQFFADPFSAGAYEPSLHRASNWHTMRRFTLDLAFTHNVPAGVYPEGGRTLCGIERCWAILLRPDGRLELELFQPDGGARRLVLARQCGRAGTYRLAVQIDFASRTVQAWLQGPGQPKPARTLNDAAGLPADGRFVKTEYSYFTVPLSEGGPNCANRRYPPVDMTVCGLHMSAALRYADADDLLRRDNGRPADDSFRYFTGDAGTMAWLPLTDNPATEGSHSQAMLVTVQHGPAAGDAGQKGYAYFKSPAGIYGVGRPRVSDMTIRPGPVWGAGIVNWNTLSAVLRDLDIRGGFWAVGDLALGAQYTFDVRDCVLSGSEAGWSGMSNILHLKHVTFGPVGRCGILLSGSNCMLDDVKFVDPREHRSEYYFRHVGKVQYGGMNLLTNITAEAPAGSRYPSVAAFSQSSIAGTRTSFTLRRCRIGHLPPEAALLELPAYPRAAPMVLLMEDIVCRGKPISAMVRMAAPWWNGEVRGFDPGSYRKLLDYRPTLNARTFQVGATYRKRDSVLLDGRVYQCLQDHTGTDDLRPGADGAAAHWQLAVPRIMFVANDESTSAGDGG